MRAHDPAAPGERSHIPALDGVRGLAVLLVMLYHYEVRGWPWHGPVGGTAKYIVDFGWTGVDLFFVLSGFLITGILWQTRDRPRYFLNFYARRTLRIFPLYYAFLLLVFVVLPLAAPGSALAASTPFSTQIWYWAYASNVLIALHGWGAATFYTPHFWSLAVEEQFYLVWPAVMRRISRRGAMTLCLVVIGVALIVRCWLFFGLHNAAAAWVLSPARMDALAVGALLALMAAGPAGLVPVARRAVLLLVVGFGTVAALALWRGTIATTDPGVGTVGYPLIAFSWGALLVTALAEGPIAALMGRPVLRWVGRRSYAFYVLHYPILISLERSGFTPAQLAKMTGSVAGAHLMFLIVNAALTALGAEISWRLLESRMLRLKRRFA